MNVFLVSVAAALRLLSDPAPTEIQTSDLTTVYDRSVQDRLAGRNGAAIAGLNRVLAEEPANLDARLNLGLALLSEGRLGEAETAFNRVLAQAPAYGDARLGLARVAQRRGDRAAAEAILDTAETHGGVTTSEIAAFRASLTPDVGPRDAAGAWRVSVAASVSRLSEGLPDWTASSLVVSRAFGGHVLSGAVEATERFGRDDLYLEGRVDQQVGAGSVYLAVGGAPKAVYRPETAVWTGGEAPVGQLRGALDIGVARYGTGTVVTLRPGLTAPVGRDATVTAQWIAVRDETGRQRSGYSLRGALNAAPGLRLQAGYAEAPDSSDGITAKVASASLGLAYDLTPGITVFVDGVHEDRGTYRRDEASLALGWRF